MSGAQRGPAGSIATMTLPIVPRLLVLVLLGCLAAGIGWARARRAPAAAPVAGEAGVRWPAQRAAGTLLLSGRNLGKLKPCGCSAPQLGGLERLATAVEMLRTRSGDALVPVSLGWSAAAPVPLRRDREQARLKAMLYRQAMQALGYGAHLLGPSDLQVAELVASFATPGAGGSERPTLPLNMRPSASLGVDPEAPAVGWADLAAGPVAVRVLTLLDEGQGRLLHDAGLAEAVVPAAQAVQALPRQVGRVHVVALEASAAELEAVKASLRGVGACVIVDMSGATAEATHVGVVLGDTPLVVGLEEKGKNVGVLDLEVAPGGGWTATWTPQPLLPLFSGTETPSRLRQEVAGWFAVYKREVQAQGLLAMEERRAEAPGEPRYVGSAACAACHEAIYRDWHATPHAGALRTLRMDDYAGDPECLACHVQGPQWQPDGRFTWAQSGFVDDASTPYLGGVGCENCHGPGSTHVAAPYEAAVWASSRLLRARPQRQDCMTCHDLENSVGFSEQYHERLPRVNHGGVPAGQRSHAPRVRRAAGAAGG